MLKKNFEENHADIHFCSNDQAQSILLGILIKIASTLSQDQVELLLPTLTEVFEKHANGECRVSIAAITLVRILIYGFSL